MSYYLLGIILWIVFNVSLILGDLSEDLYRNKITVYIYHVDKIGGLRPLFNFILKLSAYYFICITIMIASYINPLTPVPLEMLFLFILLFIGIGFFLWGKTAVQNIFAHRIQMELVDINQKYEELEKELRNLLSQKRDSKLKEDLIFISDSIDLLNKERDRLLQLKTSVIDISSLIIFISSVLTTLVVILQKYQELQTQIRELFPFHLFK